MRLFHRSLTFLIFAISNAVPALAADGLPSGGVDEFRQHWLDRGVEFGVGYRADAMRNFSGGLQRGGQTMWQLDAQLSVDLDTLWGWRGTSAYLQVINDRGGRINERYVGSIGGVSNIEVGTAATRVFQAWLEQSALNERLLILLGLYPVDSEFATLDAAGALDHPSFGAKTEFGLTRGPSIFPVSAFGTRVRWHSPSRQTYLQGALLDGVPGNPDKPKGTHIEFNDGDGSFSIIEAGHRPGDAAQDDEARALANPFDKLAIGAWRYTAKVPDLVDASDRRSYGYYLLAEKTLYRPKADEARGLAGFARYSATDGDSSPVRDAINLGLRYEGLIPGRPADVTVLGLSRIRLGDKYLATTGAPAANEDILELTYQIVLTDWLSVQPLIELIRNPALTPARNTAIVGGVRIEIAL